MEVNFKEVLNGLHFLEGKFEKLKESDSQKLNKILNDIFTALNINNELFFYLPLKEKLNVLKESIQEVAI